MSDQQSNKEQCCCGGAGGTCCPLSGVDWVGIIRNSVDILKDPRGFWEHRKGCTATIAEIYKKYLIGAALIPVIVVFVKGSLIGYSFGGMVIKTPIISGLVQMVEGYVLMLFGLYLFACVSEWLAPKLGTTITREAAFKVCALSWLPTTICSVFMLIGWLTFIPMLVGLYTIYIAYLGFGIVGGVAEEKKLSFTASTLVVNFVLLALLNMVIGLLIPRGQADVSAGDKYFQEAIKSTNGNAQ